MSNLPLFGLEAYELDLRSTRLLDLPRKEYNYMNKPGSLNPDT